MGPRIELLNGLRIALILTSMVGLTFSFISMILSFNFIPIICFLVLAISSTLSLWVQAKAARTGTIKLPLSLHDINASKSTISTSSAPHHGLIACADFVSGSLLLTMHVLSMIIGNHNHGGIVMLYAIFAMLLACIVHYVLCLLHIRAWRKEVVDSRPVCRSCRQHMDHDAKSGQVVASDVQGGVDRKTVTLIDAEGGVDRKTVAVVEQIEGEA